MSKTRIVNSAAGIGADPPQDDLDEEAAKAQLRDQSTAPPNHGPLRNTPVPKPVTKGSHSPWPKNNVRGGTRPHSR